MNWELYYKDETGEYIIGNCTTNHSISVDDALRIADIDMDEWADEKSWDGWDWGCLNLRLI